MTKNSIAKFSALMAGVLVLPTVSWAGTMSTSKESKPVIEQVKESCITGDLGVNFVSEYISRGLVLENQGVIAQPYADLYFKLYSGEGFINKVSLNLGIWSSIHSHKQGGNTTAQNWYEFDYTTGIAVTFAKNFTATLSFFEFDSPSGAFDPARSINLNLSYDDSEALGAFALHPHVTVLREVGGAAGLQEQAWYFEGGIAPSVPIGKVATLTFPITAGFGDGKFYAGDTFGYASAGINAAVPLAFMPSCLGSWTFNTGYTYTYLGDALRDFSRSAQGNGQHSQHVFQSGLVVSF